jgi:hypothetical protein
MGDDPVCSKLQFKIQNQHRDTEGTKDTKDNDDTEMQSKAQRRVPPKNNDGDESQQCEAQLGVSLLIFVSTLVFLCGLCDLRVSVVNGSFIECE